MASTVSWHFEKHTKNAVNGLQIHNERLATKHKNERIDVERSDLNFTSKSDSEMQGLTYQQRIEQKIKERYQGKRAPRKDAIVDVQHTLQFGGEEINALPIEERQKIMASATGFLIERLGGSKNIIGLNGHRDETNDHIHLDMIPFTEDGRLSAKEIYSRQFMKETQDQLLQHLQTEFPELGFERANKAGRGFDNGRSQADFERLTDEKRKNDEFIAEKEKALTEQYERLEIDIEQQKRDLLVFWQQYDPEHTVSEHRLNPDFQEKERAVLKEATDILDKYHVPYEQSENGYIDMGTYNIRESLLTNYLETEWEQGNEPLEYTEDDQLNPYSEHNDRFYKQLDIDAIRLDDILINVNELEYLNDGPAKSDAFNELYQDYVEPEFLETEKGLEQHIKFLSLSEIMDGLKAAFERTQDFFKRQFEAFKRDETEKIEVERKDIQNMSESVNQEIDRLLAFRTDLQQQQSELEVSKRSFKKQKDMHHEQLADVLIGLGVHESWRDSIVQNGRLIGIRKDGAEVNKSLSEVLTSRIAKATGEQLQSVQDMTMRWQQEHNRGGMPR